VVPRERISSAPAIAEALREAQRLVASALGRVQLGLLPDADAVAVLQEVEALGRLVDGARVSTASEIGKRSTTALGHDGLAWRYGCRNAADLITQATRVSSREARRRLQLGGMPAPGHRIRHGRRIQRKKRQLN
jgi:hypothetical protein